MHAFDHFVSETNNGVTAFGNQGVINHFASDFAKFATGSDDLVADNGVSFKELHNFI